MDAIHQLKFMEVDQQANGDVEQFHVAEQLGLVDRQYLLDRFEFQQQAAFDQNVETKRLFEDKTLVFDSDNALVDSGQLAEAQFAEEALLINAFDQARPLETMNLDGGADDGVAQLIRLLERWMHGGILQKETKPAPVKLASTWVRVPPVELDCSRRNMNSTAPPRGGVGC